MPFHPPFKKRFEEGDLVYGVSEQRCLYSDSYEHFSGSSTPKNISTIDQYAATNVEIRLQAVYEKTTPANQHDFLRVLSSHSKYKSISNSLGFDMNGRAVHHHQVISRKCKAGLFWFSGLNNSSCIHFILDRINMEQVVKKSHPRDEHEKSFTGVELRWVYRHRHNPMVMNKIQFWLRGSPTLPPWLTDYKELWNQYVPRSDPDWASSLSQLFESKEY